MEKEKKSLKLIHLIFIGCMMLILIVAGILFFNNKSKDNQIIADMENPERLELSIEEIDIHDRNILLKYVLKVNDEELQNVDFKDGNATIFSIPKLEMENEIYTFPTYVPNVINKIDNKNYEMFFIYDYDELEIKDGAKIVSDFYVRVSSEEHVENYEDVRKMESRTRIEIRI